MTENCKFRKAILSAFYNISQRNFGILLILWCSFKLWWNFGLDQNLVYNANGPLGISTLCVNDTIRIGPRQRYTACSEQAIFPRRKGEQLYALLVRYNWVWKTKPYNRTKHCTCSTKIQGWSFHWRTLHVSKMEIIVFISYLN
jgi:hypothetical protein